MARHTKSYGKRFHLRQNRECNKSDVRCSARERPWGHVTPTGREGEGGVGGGGGGGGRLSNGDDRH